MIEELVLPNNTRYKRQIAKRYTGWRLKYPGEGGNWNPDGMPAVCPALSWQANKWQKFISPVQFNERIQRLAWDVLKRLNPNVDPKRFDKLYNTEIALTNYHGFCDPSNPDKYVPRKNYISNRDLNGEMPLLMDAIIMAGQLYQGVVEGDALAVYPGIHAMDASNPVDANTIMQREWHFYAVSWHDAGFGEHFFPIFGGKFAVPQIINEKATYPMEYFEWWNRDYLPDPLRIGG